jgi:chromosome segregation ATPase
VVQKQKYHNMTEENGPERLKDIIESDQAVEPDANVAEELRMLPEDKESIEREEMVTAYATGKLPLLRYVISKKRERLQREENILINISKQLDKQTAEIERMSSLLQSIQEYVKSLRRQQSESIKQLQSQINKIQRHASQIQKCVIKGIV